MASCSMGLPTAARKASSLFTPKDRPDPVPGQAVGASGSSSVGVRLDIVGAAATLGVEYIQLPMNPPATSIFRDDPGPPPARPAPWWRASFRPTKDWRKPRLAEHESDR
jgi:hypothetical protein